MDKWQVLHQFFASFGIPAYEANSVPTGENAPAYPYITYNLSTSYALDQCLIQASLWYYGTSPKDINLKTDEISKAIGLSKVIPCKEGAVILRREPNFAQGLSDTDPMVKRKLLTMSATYVTTY